MEGANSLVVLVVVSFLETRTLMLLLGEWRVPRAVVKSTQLGPNPKTYGEEKARLMGQ